MRRDEQQRQERNRTIYRAFLDALRNDQPIMLLYARLARQFFLTEETIRRIVHIERKKQTKQTEK